MREQKTENRGRVHFQIDRRPPTRRAIQAARREIRGRLRVRRNNLIIGRTALLVFAFISYRVIDEQSLHLLLIAMGGLFVSLGYLFDALEMGVQNPVTSRDLKQRLRDFDRLDDTELETARELMQRRTELRSYAEQVKQREGRVLVYGELLMLLEYELRLHQSEFGLDLAIAG